MPTFSLEWPPRLASAAASLAIRRSSTDPVPWTLGAWVKTESRSFGALLELRYIIRAEPLDQ